MDPSIRNNEEFVEKHDESFIESPVSRKSISRFEERGFKTLIPQILATTVATSFHIVVGMTFAYSAILLPQLSETNEILATKTQSSWIASVVVLVAPVGLMLTGFVMDNIGRLNAVKLAAIPGLIGWTMIATSNSLTVLIIGRLITGLASAIGSSPTIVYITEIARRDMRGSLISFAPTYVSLGMMLAYLKGWFLHWRVVAWTCTIYTIVPCILIMFIPESPLWLVSKGRIDQARKALLWINKYQPQNLDKNESLTELQLEQLQQEHLKKLEQMKNNETLLRKMKHFIKPTGYKPLMILFGMFFLQQYSGIYITLFYSVNFFQEVGSSINPYLASVVIGLIRLFMSILNTYLLSTFQRRKLIVYSALGMAVCICLSGMFSTWIKEKTFDKEWVPVLLIMIYMIFSMLGLLPIPWTMTAELFPIEIRGIAHSIAYSIAYLFLFAAVQSYWSLEDLFNGHAGVQYFFGVMALCALVYTVIFLPETHDKKLSEVTEYFNNNTFYITYIIKQARKNKKTNNVNV